MSYDKNGQQLLRILGFCWAKHPEMTLGQIIAAVGDVISISDEEMLRGLQRLRHDEEVAAGTATGPFKPWGES